MKIIFDIGVACMNLIYCFHKLFPTKHRVCVISRQSAKPSMDVKMLFEELNRQDPTLETRALYKMIPPGITGKIGYLFHMMGPEMHALATSEVVLLEGYCIPASILHHKKSLKILQMWHALGIFKKFGYWVADEEEGYSTTVIEGMRMHRNYDYFLVSGEVCKPLYAKAFNTDVSKGKVIPLPRTDVLRSADFMARKQKAIYKKYPTLRDGKKNVLYAPTFRNGVNPTEAVQRLLKSFDLERYNVICKLHPLEREAAEIPGVFTCQGFSSQEMLSVADYVITDYSAFVFEAAVANKPLFFYAYDLEEYTRRRGFAIDYMTEMPTVPQKDAESIVEMIEADDYNVERLKAFADRYVAGTEHNTQDLAQFVRLLYNK